jgi:hypothetical protein
MALLTRIYFNAVFGALGGLLGWMLFGVFGDKNPTQEPGFLFLTQEQTNWLLGGALIGGLIGYFVVSVEAIRDRSLIRFVRLASYGIVLGVIGGALGMLIAEGLHQRLIAWLGRYFVVEVIARGLAWSILGMAIGMSEGIAARSLGKFSYGLLGGTLGGFVGGCLFRVLYGDPTAAPASPAWTALGLVIMGACIG